MPVETRNMEHVLATIVEEKKALFNDSALAHIEHSLSGSEFALAGVSSPGVDDSPLRRNFDQKCDCGNICHQGQPCWRHDARAFGRRGKPSVVQGRRGEGGHDSEHFGVLPAGMLNSSCSNVYL
jgi:hypothetical protein